MTDTKKKNTNLSKARKEKNNINNNTNRTTE